MKRSNVIAIFLITSCAIIRCTNNSTEKMKASISDYNIDFEKSFNTERQMLLSEITDSILYVILKTPPEIVITSVRKVLNTDRFLFVQAKGDVYQFFKNGQFIRRIGSKGKGPGEYYIASDFFIDVGKREIAIISYPKLLYFSLDGKYHKQQIINSTNVCKQDSLLWCTTSPSSYLPWKLVAINTKLDTVVKIKNDKWIQPKGDLRMVVAKLSLPFYTFDGQYYFNGDEDHYKILKIDGNKYNTYATVNMGKYKLPSKYHYGNSYSKFVKYGHNYYGIPRVAEDNNYMYLTVKPRYGTTIFSDYSLVYNKKSYSGFIAKDKGQAGITDDILEGPPFWPLTVTDDYYIGCIEAFEFIKVAKDNYKFSVYLKNILFQIDENSNQLLILCERKD